MRAAEGVSLEGGGVESDLRVSIAGSETEVGVEAK
jgi:hypothetical protein